MVTTGVCPDALPGFQSGLVTLPECTEIGAHADSFIKFSFTAATLGALFLDVVQESLALGSGQRVVQLYL